MSFTDRHAPAASDNSAGVGNAPHTDGPGEPRYTAELPVPDVRKSRWPFPIVWVIPLIAAVAAAWYLWGIYKEHGVEIAITFDDASNLRVRDTPLTYHGVRVGSVSSIDLNEDRTRALVRVRLNRPFQDTIARDGGQFWLVRPDAAGGMLSGLSTVITGPYIDCIPGGGDANYRFEGFDSRPTLIGEGLRVVLHTDRLAHLEVRSPVFFRGLQVGLVQDIRFSDDARGVNVTLFIWKRYTKLLTRTSQFWQVTGTDISGSLLSGLNVSINNTRALLSGGVGFATPDDGDIRPVRDGATYVLNDAADKDWLTWSAKIDLPAGDNPGQPEPGPMPRVGVP